MSNNLKNRSSNLHTPKTRKNVKLSLKKGCVIWKGIVPIMQQEEKLLFNLEFPLWLFFQAAVVPKGTIMSFPILLHLPPLHIICIRTISSLHLLAALLNRFKLVYGWFCKGNIQNTLNFCPYQPEMKLNVNKTKNK